MCRDCPNWCRQAIIVEHGDSFASCALKPDRFVRDKRVPGGLVEQADRTSATYECKDFPVRIAKVASPANPA